jgi:hypothetical protein
VAFLFFWPSHARSRVAKLIRCTPAPQGSAIPRPVRARPRHLRASRDTCVHLWPFALRVGVGGGAGREGRALRLVAGPGSAVQRLAIRQAVRLGFWCLVVLERRIVCVFCTEWGRLWAVLPLGPVCRAWAAGQCSRAVV